MSNDSLSDDRDSKYCTFYIPKEKFDAINLCLMYANYMAQVLEQYKPALTEAWEKIHYPVANDLVQQLAKKI